MSNITHSISTLHTTQTIDQQSVKKRTLSVDFSSIVQTEPTKKLKRSTDAVRHWKKLQACYETITTKPFECKSKSDYLIVYDPLDDRSRHVLSKSSHYWLVESVRLMQQHVEYGNTFDAIIIGEMTEIERNLKALKGNVEKTFFHRAEGLHYFIRLCCTLYDNPPEKHRRRLHALLTLCACSWVHMLDVMLPNSIVRVQKSFIFDDDNTDFEDDSILGHYLKDDQKKIKKVNNELPNLCHILYSLVLLVEKFFEAKLIDRDYVDRLRVIYQIWLLIDNEINSRDQKYRPSRKTSIVGKQNISWNFLDECKKYERIFGAFISNVK